MAMTVQIDCLTGAGPTATPTTSVTFNREDSIAGTTPIPVPSAAGTNFSWVKSFQPEITAVAGLTMTDLRVGKVAAETVTGTKLWLNNTNVAYTQAVGSPTATGDNNVTPPTINGDASVELPLITAPPAVYSAGPHSSTGRKGNIVEVVAGVANNCTTTGAAVASPTIRWTWVEA